MKRIILPLAALIISVCSYSQGQFSYEPKAFNISLLKDTSVLAISQRSASYNSLSDFQKEFLYAVNYARLKPVSFVAEAVVPYLALYPNLKLGYGESLVSDLTGYTPSGSLQMTEKLTLLAVAHAMDLADHNLMSHVSSNGITTQQRFEKVGILCGSECINMATQAAALEVLLSLLVDYKVPDHGHRKSLLNHSMGSVGVGFANNKANGLQYTVVDLGCM